MRRGVERGEDNRVVFLPCGKCDGDLLVGSEELFLPLPKSG